MRRFLSVSLVVLATAATSAAGGPWPREMPNPKFVNQPWSEVFGWVGRQGVTISLSNMPAGTFTFLACNRDYSLEEFIDVVRDALRGAGYDLVFENRTLSVQPHKIVVIPPPLPEEPITRERREEPAITRIVALARADVIANSLNGLHADLSIKAMDDFALVVVGPKARVDEIASAVQTLTPPPAAPKKKKKDDDPAIVFIDVPSLKPDWLAKTIRDMFVGWSGFFVDAEVTKKTLIVRGTPEQIAEVQKTVEVLEKKLGTPVPPAPTLVSEIIAVNTGNPDLVATQLRVLYGSDPQAAPFTVTTGVKSVGVRCPASLLKEVQEVVKKLDVK